MQAAALHCPGGGVPRLSYSAPRLRRTPFRHRLHPSPPISVWTLPSPHPPGSPWAAPAPETNFHFLYPPPEGDGAPALLERSSLLAEAVEAFALGREANQAQATGRQIRWAGVSAKSEHASGSAKSVRSSEKVWPLMTMPSIAWPSTPQRSSPRSRNPSTAGKKLSGRVGSQSHRPGVARTRSGLVPCPPTPDSVPRDPS
jgi:hypothetical protein